MSPERSQRNPASIRRQIEQHERQVEDENPADLFTENGIGKQREGNQQQMKAIPDVSFILTDDVVRDPGKVAPQGTAAAKYIRMAEVIQTIRVGDLRCREVYRKS